MHGRCSWCLLQSPLTRAQCLSSTFCGCCFFPRRVTPHQEMLGIVLFPQVCSASDKLKWGCNSSVSLPLSRAALAAFIPPYSLWDQSEAKILLKPQGESSSPALSCFPYSPTGFSEKHPFNKSSVQRSLSSGSTSQDEPKTACRISVNKNRKLCI